MTTYGEVVEVERLSPSMVRVVLGGDGLAEFAPVPCTDQYVNALFVPDDAPYSVPFDPEEVKELPVELRPRGRRYTIRSWDAARGRLAIDFVVHGDVGHAGRWAARAEPGDRLQIVGPAGGYAPDPEADWYLMVGDESALPAIGASLEALAEGSVAVVIVVVDGPPNEQPLTGPTSVDVRWVHREAAPGDPDLLCRAVEELEFPPGEPDVFVHGEASEVRAIRRHLVADRGIRRDGASISPYWRRAHSDEQWREIKAAWLAESANDF